MMTFRQSLHRLINSSYPDSPTDCVFLFGSLIMIALWIYATLTRTTVPHVTELIGFLVLCKTVKVAGKFAGGGNVAAPPTSP